MASNSANTSANNLQYFSIWPDSLLLSLAPRMRPPRLADNSAEPRGLLSSRRNFGLGLATLSQKDSFGLFIGGKCYGCPIKISPNDFVRVSGGVVIDLKRRANQLFVTDLVGRPACGCLQLPQWKGQIILRQRVLSGSSRSRTAFAASVRSCDTESASICGYSSQI